MRHRSGRGVMASAFMVGFIWVLGCAVGLSGAQAQEQVFSWRIQAAFPSSSIYFELLKRFSARIEKVSQGRLKAEVLAEGAVARGFEILEAVDRGAVEGGCAWTHFWSGKHPAGLLFSAPAGGSGRGLDQMSHMSWAYEGGGQDLLNQFYAEVLKANVVAFLFQPMGPDPLGWFKRPIRTLQDLRGLKYVSPPGVMAEVLREMGVSAVSLDGAEIVTAAQRGAVDAAKWMGPADDLSLGFASQFKHYYLQGLHQTTNVSEILIHKGFWNSLPADLQEIIRSGILASIAETYQVGIQRNALALRLLKERHQVEVQDTPEDFYGEYLRACNKVLDKNAARDAFFKRVLDSQQQFADLVAPYWTKSLMLYRVLGEKAKGKNED